MLQVYVYGPYENGWLDIDPSTTLEVEEVREMFNEDLSTGLYTLPAEFTWTDKNRRLLGFNERLENFNKKEKIFRCDVYDSGWPEMVSAKLTILEKKGNFTYKSGTFNCNIAGTLGLFGTAIRGKTLKDLYLDGTINWAALSSRQFAYNLMGNNYPSYAQRLTFAPVAIENFFDTSAPWYSGEFLAKDTVNTIVFTSGLGLWEFGRPTSANPAVAAAPGTAEYLDHRTVPFFKLKYVLQKVFTEHDFTLSGDFITSTDFDDLVIFNNYAIEQYFGAPNYLDVNTTINPRNHVPKMSIADFIRGIFDFFSMYPVFEGNAVKLVYRKQELSQQRILKLSQFAGEIFNSTFTEETPHSGYKLNYTWDGQDGYNSERVKELTDKTLVAHVAVFADLAALNIGRGLTTNDIAYVNADNLYYCVADATNPLAIKWDAYAEKLNEFKKGNGERSVDLGLSTLCTYTEFNSATALYERRDYLGTRQAGSFRNNRGTIIENEYGLRIFYIKRLQRGVYDIPVSFYHNRDMDNSVIEKYSLALQGDDGVVKQLHEHWQNALDRAEVVKVPVTADSKLLKELKDCNTVDIDNVLYLPKQINRQIPNDESVELELLVL